MKIKIKFLSIIFILIFISNKIYSQIPDYLPLEGKGMNVSKEHAYLHCKQKYNRLLETDAVRRRPFDVLKYDIYLDWYNPLNSTSQLGDGYVWNGINKITMRLDSNNVGNIILDASMLKIDSAFINNVKLNNITKQDNNTISLALPQPGQKNDLLQVEVFYTYRLSLNAGFFCFKKGYTGKDYMHVIENLDETLAYTSSEPDYTRFWLPCNDSPYDKAEAAITVRVPQGYTVASNGLLGKVKETPFDKTYYWSDTTKISTYLICAAASKYKEYSDWYKRRSNPADSVEIKYYVFQKDYDNTEINDSTHNARYVLKNMPYYLEIMSDMFGEFPFSKLGCAFVEPYNVGAMENQTMIVSNRHLLQKRYESVFLHETAHHWFGDLTTCKTWNDVWFNEGGATWCEALWLERIGGEQAYHYSLNDEKHNYQSRHNLDSVPIFGCPPELAFSTYSALIYSKASWVFHMLRFTLGDSTIFSVLNSLFKKYAFSSLETEDFISHFVTSVKNPIIPLDSYIREMLFAAGYPIYDMTFSPYTGSDKNLNVTVNINQVQSGIKILNEYTAPLRLLFYDNNGNAYIQTVINNNRNQIFHFNIPFYPQNVEIDKRYTFGIVNSTLGFNNGELTIDDKVKVYPNPVEHNGILNILIQTGIPGNLKVNLYNSKGSVVENIFTGLNLNNGLKIPYKTEGLAIGAYFISIESKFRKKYIPVIIN